MATVLHQSKHADAHGLVADRTSPTVERATSGVPACSCWSEADAVLAEAEQILMLDSVQLECQHLPMPAFIAIYVGSRDERAALSRNFLYPSMASGWPIVAHAKQWAMAWSNAGELSVRRWSSHQQHT
ncbi:MAG: hypothetical protein ABI586_09830 [Candidatus Nanopelagicales bacterium]